MRGTKLLTSVIMGAAAIALAAPAQADYDTDFKNTVNGFGIYLPQDELAWMGKISCDRINRGVDTDPYKSADFIQKNLARGTTQGQAFQFLGAAIDHYCPNQVAFIQGAGR